MLGTQTKKPIMYDGLFNVLGQSVIGFRRPKTHRRDSELVTQAEGDQFLRVGTGVAVRAY